MTVWLVFDASDQYPILEVVCATEEAAREWVRNATAALQWSVQEWTVIEGRTSTVREEHGR